jgi:hypothetical protein
MSVPLSDLSKSIAAKRNATLKTLQKPQPRAPAPRQQSKSEKPLPSSPEMEKAVLSLLLLHPKEGFAAFENSARDGFFTTQAGEWFKLMRGFYREKGNLDSLSFLQFLLDNPKLFDPIGGRFYWGEIQGIFPPIEMLDFYLSELREKYLQRQIMVRSFALAGKASSLAPNENAVELLMDMARTVEDLKHAAGGPNGMQRFDLDLLKTFDCQHDPNCLVGHRWLVRGGSCLVAGSAGVGKSTLAMQLAIYWAAGEKVFGPRPIRPLKSLILQAEDDEGDVSEQYQGVMAGIRATDDIDFQRCGELIDKNLLIYRCAGYSGSRFLSMLDELAELEKPDLIWINPLFSFAGCDLLNAKETGFFLREGLFPLASKRNACAIVIHHIGKPARVDQPDMSDIDIQYLGFGTSEIQNAFRAINVIVSAKTSGVYKFTFSKRGERAGAKTPEGKFAQSVFLKHSSEGLCWLQVDEPVEAKKGRQSKFTQDDILLIMDAEEPRTPSQLQYKLYKEKDMSRRTFFNLWDELKDERKIQQKENGWIITFGVQVQKVQ